MGETKRLSFVHTSVFRFSMISDRLVSPLLASLLMKPCQPLTERQTEEASENHKCKAREQKSGGGEAP